MKRKILSILFVLIFALSLMVPAQAAAEIGHYYDETHLLYSDDLVTLGAQVLPAFLKNYDFDLRVDVLTGMGEFSTVEEASEYLYTTYEYGSSNAGGTAFTVLVHEDADGVALDGWYAYFGGENDFWVTNAPWNMADVYDIMTEENWSGDLTQDIETLTDAITAMVEGLEGFIFAGGTGTYYETTPESVLSITNQGTEEPKQEPASEPVPELDNVTDAAALLTESEWQTLEQQARTISEQYGVGVYIITVDDYRDYAGGDVTDAAEKLYFGYKLGLGDNQDGILLLLSMAQRDYDLMVEGEYANYAFNTPGREHLVEFFLDDFGDNRWYDGFSDYLTWSADYLETAKNGEPYSDQNIPMDEADRIITILIWLAIILLVPLAVAGVYTLILVAKMHSVAKAVEASAYMTGDLHLTRRGDYFTHKTETRRKIETESSSSSSKSSGSTSHTSGKF